MSGAVVVNFSKMIGQYFGIIEGIDTKITKLYHQSFNSSQSNLKFAYNSTGQNQIDYIKQAKDEFIRAVAVEENENKVLALTGLSLCQYCLSDLSNAKYTYAQISAVMLTRSEKVKTKITAHFRGMIDDFFWNITGTESYFPIDHSDIIHENRINSFEECKNKCVKMMNVIYEDRNNYSLS